MHAAQPGVIIPVRADAAPDPQPVTDLRLQIVAGVLPSLRPNLVLALLLHLPGGGHHRGAKPSQLLVGSRASEARAPSHGRGAPESRLMHVAPGALGLKAHKPLRPEERSDRLKPLNVHEGMVRERDTRAIRPRGLRRPQRAHRCPRAKIIGRHDDMINVGASETSAEGEVACFQRKAHAQADRVRPIWRRRARAKLPDHGCEVIVLPTHRPPWKGLLSPRKHVEITHPSPGVRQLLDVLLAGQKTGDSLISRMGPVQAQEVKGLLPAASGEHQVSKAAHVRCGGRGAHVNPPHPLKSPAAVDGHQFLP